MSLEAAGAALAIEAARIAALGWMRGTAGNLSLVLGREPLRLAVTASGIDKGALGASDVVLVDERGAAVDPAEPRRPSAESALHARIAALTGAGAVVHVHPLAAVLAADAHPNGLVVEGLEMLKGIGRAAEGDHVRLPVVANSQNMTVVGDRVAAALEPGVPAVLVARHGLYAWGADLTQARHHTEIVVWLLEFVTAGGCPTTPG
ncbi:MAG TPA: methylthioribulose 1-phosphate dehydratase [Chloroflexota bacterium]